MNDWGEAQLARLRHPELAKIIQRNVRSISEEREKAEKRRNFQEHLADWVTRFAGSMLFVYLHLAWFAAWIVAHYALGFDPNFAALTMIVSLEAIFLSVFVLVSQNRQAELADKRAELDLQINLLAEYETTKLLKIVTALAQKSGAMDADDTELEELKAEVEPKAVLQEIEAHNGKST